MKSRMKEPSTWAGIGTVLSAIAQIIPNPIAQAAVLGLAAMAGAQAMKLRESAQ